jgi:hypothetical protein
VASTRYAAILKADQQVSTAVKQRVSTCDVNGQYPISVDAIGSDDIVTVSLCSTGTSVASYVYTVRNGSPTKIFYMEADGVWLTMSGGDLTVHEPFCCPSDILTTYYRWNGTKFLRKDT